MSFIWFVIALIFFILWRSKTSKESGDTPSDDFSRGYDTGKRELEGKLRERLEAGDVSRESLEQLISPPMMNVPTPLPLAQVPLQEDISNRYVSEAAAYPQAVVAQPVAPPKPHNPASTLNVVLYLASFLLVAAAAALIAASMPASIKLAGLIAVVVLFYCAGIILHYKVAILRPAAVAFIGTGLAILPFVGFALTALTGMPGSTAWMIISLVGLAAYYAAAIILQSQVVSYLTLGFVLSLSCSVVSVIHVGFVWYFVALIIVSLSASVVAYFKPSWVPKVFSRPLDLTGTYVTPIAVGASLLSYESMNIRMYEVVLSAATLYYLVQLLQRRTQTLEIISRISVHVTLLLYAGDLAAGNATTFGIIWLILATAQIAYSLIRIRPAYLASVATEYIFIVASMVLCLFGLGFWIGSSDSASLSLLNWAVIGASGLAATFRLRSAHWAYATLVSSLFIPSIFTQSVVNPAMPKEWLVAVYLLAVIVGTWGLDMYRLRSTAVHVLFYCSISVWFLAALFNAIATGQLELIAVVCAIGAITATMVSFITLRSSLIIVAGVACYAALACLIGYLHVADDWRALGTGVVSALVAVVGAYAFHALQYRARRNYLLASAAAFLATTAFGLTYGITAPNYLTYGIFALVTLVALILRAGRTSSGFVTNLLIITYVCYTFLLWIAGLVLGGWWLVGAYIIGAVVLVAASRIEKISWLLWGANASIVAAVSLTLTQIGSPEEWRLLYATWIAAALFGGMYAYYQKQGDLARQWISIGSFWAITVYGALSGLGSEDQAYQYCAAVTLAATGASAMYHAAVIKVRALLEGGLYLLVLAAQLMVAIAAPDLNMVFYAYWWAAVIAAVAAWFKTRVDERLLLALAIVTFVTGGYALTDGGTYSLLFLIQNVVVAGAGAVYQKRIFLWWGVAAAFGAIIYFLRDYVYVWLALLGLFLIGVVVWRLIVISRRTP